MNDVGTSLTWLPEDLREIGERIRRSYPKVEPSAEYRELLHSRLVTEARRLHASRPPAPVGLLVRRVAVGAAALSVAGVAVLLWRSRLASALASESRGQLQPAEAS